MLLRAFAKINLDLQILGRRDDGYHEVETVLQTIDWFDEIHIEPSTALEFIGPGTPEDETNLVIRAVRTFERLAGVTANVRIRLTKNIPIGRGLGGGSSNAAVTFIGLRRLYDKTLDRENVLEALRSFGSDVPFFAIGGTARGTGRGDEIAGLEDIPVCWLVLVDPDISISTADAYSWLTVPDRFNTIKGFRALSDSNCKTGESSRNDFEVPVFQRYPELAEIKKEFETLGACKAMLSGSGSAVFGQFDGESDARRAALALASRYRVKLTKPLPRLEYFQRMVEE